MVKLVRKIQKSTYLGNDGKEHNHEMFYIELANGVKVSILPNTNYDKNARQTLKIAVDEVIDERAK